MNSVAAETQAAPELPAGRTRRMFVGVAAGAVGVCYAAAVAYPVYRYLASPLERAAALAAITEVTVKDADKLPAGRAVMFKFGPRPAILIHLQDGRWAAFDAVCTHLGCTVEFQADQNRIRCACHGGVYDPVTGRNVAGPPPRPLRAYKVSPTEGGLLVSRV